MDHGESKVRLRQPIGPRDHIFGTENAPVTLVEYGDYECSFCAAAEPVLKEVLTQRNGMVRLVYRNFPLRQIHPHAEMAAEAAEAAGEQHRFWEMHDLLFKHQDALDTNDLIAYAGSLLLDIDRFSTDLFQGKFSVRVLDDLRWAIRSGVDRTPTLFINGNHYTGPIEAKALIRAIDIEISSLEQRKSTA